MIEKIFKCKVSFNDKNNAFVEYAKRWVKTWFHSLDNEEEHKYSYHRFIAFMDSDLARQGLGHAHAHILEGYLFESFHQKEHFMVKYVRIYTRYFEGSTSDQAEHETGL
jgi:hypothetical protein